MLVGVVGKVPGAGFANLPGVYFAVSGGQRQHLVAGGLHGAGFMHVDVAVVGAEHALPGPERGFDDDEVRLRAADQKLHVGPGRGAGGANEVTGLVAVMIFAVAGRLFEIALGEKFQNARMRAFFVVRFKTKHGCHLLFSSRFQRQSTLSATWQIS